MTKAEQASRARWNCDEHGEPVEPQPSPAEAKRWTRRASGEPQLDLHAEIATLRVQQEIEKQKRQEIEGEVRELRALIAPPTRQVEANPHYAWAVSHQREVRVYAGRWIGISAERGGIVADGDRMVDVRNTLREAGLLRDSYVIFVPPDTPGR